MAAVVHVFHEPRLIDRHQRAKTHGNGWELPVIGHQPWVRVGGQPVAINLRAEVLHLLFCQTAFHEGTCVDARDHVTLEEHQVATVDRRLRAPEVVQADVIHDSRGSEGGDVAAVFAADFVAAYNGCHRVPAVDRADAPFHIQIAGEGFLLIHGDRVLIWGCGGKRQVRPRCACLLYRFVQQVMRPVRAIARDHILNGILPFSGFNRINIVQWFCHVVTSSLNA